MKKCSNCGIGKMKTDFCFGKHFQKYEKYCLQCRSINHKEVYSENYDIISQKQGEWIKINSKNWNFLLSIISWIIFRKSIKNENIGVKITLKMYNFFRKKNQNDIKAKRNEFMKIRREMDLNCKLVWNLRNKTHHASKSQIVKEKTNKNFYFLGCSLFKKLCTISFIG